MDYIEIIRLRRLFLPYLSDDSKDKQTMNVILNYLKTLNQDRLTIRTYRNGVIVHIKALTSSKRLIAYRANMTALPKESLEEIDYQSAKKGVRHACGYDIHLTIALGLITEILTTKVDHAFLFIFQSSQSNLIKGLLNSKQMQSYKIDEIYSIQFDPSLKANQLQVGKGVIYAHCNTFKVKITTKQNAFIVKQRDVLKADPVMRSTELIVRLQSSLKKLTTNEDVMLSFCKIDTKLLDEHSTKMVTLEGTIRALDSEVLNTLKIRIEQLIQTLMISYSSEINITYGLSYPVVYNDPELAGTMSAYFNNKKQYQVISCSPNLYGNDFGFYTNKFKGLMITIGVQSNNLRLERPRLLPNEIIIQRSLRLLYFYMQHRVNELRVECSV